MNARKQILQNSGLCFNCLLKNHIVGECKSPGRCRKCRGKHHTGICEIDDRNRFMMQENLVRDRRIQKQQLQIPTTPYPQIPTTPHQHVPTTHSQIFLLPHNHRFLLPHNNRILLPTIADSYNPHPQIPTTPHPQIPTTPQPQIPITQQQQQQSHQEIP